MKGFLFFTFCFLLCVSFAGAAKAQLGDLQHKANVKITFINTINKLPVILDSGNYTNCWKENFTLSKLKYYISNIGLQTAQKKMIWEENSYHLINEEDAASRSLLFYMPPSKYSSVSFLIGVDSFKNVSGAQAGALDPLNSMFWTWNTGYIMFKLEGNSPQSTSINNKIEYHIGGFSGPNNVLRKAELNFGSDTILINKEHLTELVIRTNLDKIWNAVAELKISNTSVCTSPGVLAATIANNYSKAFEIIKIIY